MIPCSSVVYYDDTLLLYITHINSTYIYIIIPHLLIRSTGRVV